MKYIIRDFTRFTYKQCEAMGEYCLEKEIPVSHDLDDNTVILEIDEDELIIFKLRFGV